MPNFVRLFATDNQRLRAFMTPYLELMRADSGLTPLDHELIALVSAHTNGCAYCCAHHGARLARRVRRSRVRGIHRAQLQLADLSSRDRAMLDFAVMVLKEPESIGDAERDACARKASTTKRSGTSHRPPRSTPARTVSPPRGEGDEEKEGEERGQSVRKMRACVLVLGHYRLRKGWFRTTPSPNKKKAITAVNYSTNTAHTC